MIFSKYLENLLHSDLLSWLKGIVQLDSVNVSSANDSIKIELINFNIDKTFPKDKQQQDFINKITDKLKSTYKYDMVKFLSSYQALEHEEVADPEKSKVSITIPPIYTLTFKYLNKDL